MPTYQYACTACDERLEAVQSFTDAPLTECPACGGALRKVFSAVGVVFKGSGFYKNDSRGSKGAESKGAESKGADGTKGETKADGGGGDKAAATSGTGGSGKDSSPKTAAPASPAPASKSA